MTSIVRRKSRQARGVRTGGETARLGVMAVTLLSMVSAHAADATLSSLGQSGGLVIPDGSVLPEGTFEGQFDNYIDPRLGARASSSQVYWGAVGILPYVEISGGLVNYPQDNATPTSWQTEHFVVRHLVANVKAEIPKFFRYQPDLALGVTDIGGQTHFFRSTYGVASQDFGPLKLTFGYGHGDRLDGPFGGAELQVWKTGLSLLAEDDARTPYIGIRYRTPSVHWLADASLIATVARSLGTTNGVAPRTSIAVGVQIPFGRRFSAPAAQDNGADDVLPSDAWQSRTSTVPSVRTPAVLAVDSARAAPSRVYASAPDIATAPAPALTTALHNIARADVQPPDSSPFERIVGELTAAGLERVRVAAVGRDLIVQYENHRFNQNEADALGIVLGVASVDAPPGVERIRVEILKAGETMGEVSVDRVAYASFVAGGAAQPAQASMRMSTRPTYDSKALQWYGNAHDHGWVRIQVEPVTNYLYGTEYGNFDYSLGASVSAFVPLWRGAELYANAIAPLVNSRNMDNGGVYAAYRLRGGMSSAALAQTFWLTSNVLNVTAVGKFDFNYVGVENEATYFVPGRDDLVRLRLAYLHHEPGRDDVPYESNAMLTYRWVLPSWNAWVEGGVARYVGGDKGPLVSFTRWFDDVSVSVDAEHSGRGNFVGVTMSFPLTPRRGMKPGPVQVQGAGQFALDFRSRVGSTNYLSSYAAAQNLSFAYDPEQVLLNAGRFGAGYFAGQIYRMRDAYERYARPAADRDGAVRSTPGAWTKSGPQAIRGQSGERSASATPAIYGAGFDGVGLHVSAPIQ